MPQIKEYTQRVDAAGGPVQGRRVSGDDLGAGMFQQVARVGNATAELGEAIYKKQEQEEIHDIAVKMSERAALLKTELNEQLRKGEIDSEQFLNKYDEEMGGLAGNYSTSGGKDYFEKTNANIRSDFIFSTAQAQAEVAGVKAVSSFQTTSTNLQSGVQKDPSSFETLRQVQDDYTDELVKSGAIDFKTAERLKADNGKKLAEAAIRGWADLNPHDAKAQIEQGLWDQHLDSDSKKQMATEIQTGINAKRIDQERQEALVKKQKEEAQKLRMNQNLQKMFEGKLSAKEIVYDDTLDFGQKKQMLDMLEQETKGPVKTDAVVLSTTFDRIHLPDGDPRKITSDTQINQLFAERKISKEDLNFLRKELEGDGTEEGRQVNALRKQVLEQAKSRLVKSNPLMGIRDPDGEETYAKFLIQFNKDYRAGIEAGKSPTSLLDPDSSDYVGNTLKNYVKTPQQILRGSSVNIQKAPPINPEKEKKPTESPADFLKRTRGGN